jgi:hypothetical protein
MRQELRPKKQPTMFAFKSPRLKYLDVLWTISVLVDSRSVVKILRNVTVLRTEWKGRFKISTSAVFSFKLFTHLKT